MIKKTLQFRSKDYGLIVGDDGLLQTEKGTFYQDSISETSSGLSREELLALFEDLKETRRTMLNYIHDRKLASKLSIEEIYERWAQIYTIETIIRLIRDITYREVNDGK